MEITADESMVGLRLQLAAFNGVQPGPKDVGVVDGVFIPPADCPGWRRLLWLADIHTGVRFGSYAPDELQWPDEGIEVAYLDDPTLGDDAPPTVRVFRHYREAADLLVRCALYENLRLVRLTLCQYHLDDLALIRFGAGKVGAVLPPAELITVRS